MVILMSEKQVITVKATPEQKQQIVRQADNQDEDISEFVLKSAEQRISREVQTERVDELGMGSRLQEIADAVRTEIVSATDMDTQQEFYYEVALWELISSDYTAEECAAAMDTAPEKVVEDLEELRQKQGGER